MKDHSTFLRQLAQGVLVGLVFVMPFSNAAIEILFPILLLTWAGGWFFHGKGGSSIWRMPVGRSTLTFLLLYLAVCTWSVSLSSHPDLSLMGLIRKTFEYALLFIIAADVARNPAMPSRLRLALFLSAALVVLHSLIQEWAIAQVSSPVLPVDPIRGRDLVYRQMVGPYSNPNDLATFLMVALLVILAQISGQTRHPWAPWILGIVLAGCLAWTQSKGALLGFAAGLLILVLLHPGKKWLWGIGFAVVCLPGALLFLKQEHLLAALTLTDASSTERGIMWQTGWRMVKDHPWIGVGLNTFMANFFRYEAGADMGPAYSHNCFLQIAAETGVLGLVSFGAFLGAFLKVLWRFLRQNLRPSENAWGGGSVPWGLGLLAALIAFLIQSIFDTNLYVLRQAVLFWTLAGVAFGTAQARDEGATHTTR